MPRTPPKRRFRRNYTFTMGQEAMVSLERLAKLLDLPRSRVLERLVTIDYQTLFRAFEAKKRFSEIVIETGYAPAVVRALFVEYVAGFSPVDASTAKLEKKIELERVRQQTIELQESLRSRRAHIKKSADIIKSEAVVRAAKIISSRASGVRR